MGRYFMYRMHPFSVAELTSVEVPRTPIRPPSPARKADLEALWVHGGYPEPFVKRDGRFTNRWRGLRHQQLLREDARDLTQIQEIAQLEALATILADRSGAQLVYANLAPQVDAAVSTVRRWVNALCALHFGFIVRPWYRNVAKGLRKEPKWFLHDWSSVQDRGRRAETYVACHLLKAVQGWTDLGFGQFDLCYLRDKAKREVDFLVVRDQEPWFLVEAKQSETVLAPALRHFQRQIGAPHAFQVVVEGDYVAADCFTREEPAVVPAATFLSQLL